MLLPPFHNIMLDYHICSCDSQYKVISFILTFYSAHFGHPLFKKNTKF